MCYFKLQVRYGFAVFSIFACLIYLFSFEIINFFNGKEYAAYSYLLTGFILIYMYITMLQRYLLRTLEITKVIFTPHVAAIFFSFVSFYPVILFFGIDGMLIIQLFLLLLSCALLSLICTVKSKAS